MEGLVYDIQGYSVHDGPGIRTTVFLKGCPLRCPWCHSPESQSFQPQVCYKKTSCRGLESCTRCIEACPLQAIGPGAQEASLAANPEDGPGQLRTLVSLDRARCTDCGACASACWSKALYVCGTPYTPEAALARVLKDKAFYDASGGGVTLSGGEPLCQPAFAVAFLRGCKDAGLSTALDTTGCVPWERVAEALPFTDLFLYDLKHLDSALHQQVVGAPNERILDNARRIADAGGALQIRIPVIPQFNDTEENIEATAAFVAELGSAVTCVQLLPYHTLGVAKYEKLQWSKPIFEAPPMSEERVREFAPAFERRGIKVTIH